MSLFRDASNIKLNGNTPSSVYLNGGLIWAYNTFNVTNNGSGNYIINGVSNSTLSVTEGQTYTFNISAVGHPFWIQTTSGAYSSGNVYSSGVTGNGTANGTITFIVPYNAPSTLYYVCQYHSGMAGTINVTDVP